MLYMLLGIIKMLGYDIGLVTNIKHHCTWWYFFNDVIYL